MKMNRQQLLKPKSGLAMVSGFPAQSPAGRGEAKTTSAAAKKLDLKGTGSRSPHCSALP
jgi:hypothetical protein